LIGAADRHWHLFPVNIFGNDTVTILDINIPPNDSRDDTNSSF
jgi:hypothetical protein